jgi:glutaredoxin 3
LSRAEVVIYLTDWCPYCARARGLLEKKGVVPREIDVEAVAGAREEMQGRSGRSTVPQIFIGDEHVGGCEDLIELEKSGYLDTLLKTTGALTHGQ